jgi:hypothetical protein
LNKDQTVAIKGGSHLASETSARESELAHAVYDSKRRAVRSEKSVVQARILDAWLPAQWTPV